METRTYTFSDTFPYVSLVLSLVATGLYFYVSLRNAFAGVAGWIVWVIGATAIGILVASSRNESWSKVRYSLWAYVALFVLTLLIGGIAGAIFS